MDVVVKAPARIGCFVAFCLALAPASAQQSGDWTLDVHILSSFDLTLPAPGEGVGWNGQSLAASDSALFGRWGGRGTRSYGVSIRRRIGKVGLLSFGFEQVRRMWTVEADWMPPLASAPMASGSLDWIVASYAIPVLYRTEVTLTPGWRLGAGGGLVMEILPTNAFAAASIEGGGDVFAIEHESLRYAWNRWGMALELGLVKEGEERDWHIGGLLRPMIQPLIQGGLSAQWNLGQEDAGSGSLERVLDGSWWGLDFRVILH